MSTPARRANLVLQVCQESRACEGGNEASQTFLVRLQRGMVLAMLVFHLCIAESEFFEELVSIFD